MSGPNKQVFFTDSKNLPYWAHLMKTKRLICEYDFNIIYQYTSLERLARDKNSRILAHLKVTRK